MGYQKNPPAPHRFIDGEPVVAAVPVALRWPSLTDLVLQQTALAECFVPDPTDTPAPEAL